MDEIGVAAGTTGPALYRYFASKEELLVTAFRRTGHRIAGDAVRAMESAADDGDVTWRLIDTYADIAFSNEDLLVVYLREARSLPEDVRREMAAIDEDFISTWTAAVRAAAPSLIAAEARVAALAIIGVINAAVRAPGIRGEQARRAWARAAAAGATAAVTG
jgi:AcrR family transcriptional regulator